MTHLTAFGNEPLGLAPRSPRSAGLFQDWALQLVLELLLVAAVVAELVECAIALNG